MTHLTSPHQPFQASAKLADIRRAVDVMPPQPSTKTVWLSEISCDDAVEAHAVVKDICPNMEGLNSLAETCHEVVCSLE